MKRCAVPGCPEQAGHHWIVLRSGSYAEPVIQVAVCDAHVKSQVSVVDSELTFNDFESIRASEEQRLAALAAKTAARKKRRASRQAAR